MREIKTEELTPEVFRAFGTFTKMTDPVRRGNGIPGMAFHADMEILELGEAHAAAFSTTRVTDQLPKRIVALEQHSRCGEGIMSLDHDMIVYFAPAGASIDQALDEVKAFRVPPNVMLTIRPGVWHCMPFPAEAATVNVLNVLPERTYANDCTMHLLEEKDRITIVM